MSETERPNYDTMTDRELDALCAERVMGGAETEGFLCPSCGGSHFGTRFEDGKSVSRNCHDEFEIGCKWNGPAMDAVLGYSTDHNHAFAVVEKMREDGWWADMHSPFDDESAKGDWMCGFTPMGMSGWNGRPDHESHAACMPRAIVLSALKAKEPRQ